MIENNVRQPSYSEAVAGHKAVNGAKEKETQADPARFPATKKSGPPVQDERAVSIDTGRYKGAKTNFAAIKANLQASLKVNKVTEKLTIKCLRPGPGDRIDVVFGDKDEANKARVGNEQTNTEQAHCSVVRPIATCSIVRFGFWLPVRRSFSHRRSPSLAEVVVAIYLPNRVISQ